MILIFWVEVPHFAVIVAEPFAFAVTFPLELTVATEVLLLVHFTDSPDGETSAPSCTVLPLFTVRVRQVILALVAVAVGYVAVKFIFRSPSAKYEEFWIRI